ncbi:AMP-binding protein [Solwaraspora sp. WMMB335]|uniref:non-ribosomal peptide synthetase n=1 Tax=Solwaraspora sp. WMMB335 TaxID=3404118 RepID=UPI003B954578
MRTDPSPLGVDLLDPVRTWAARRPDAVAVATAGTSIRYAALVAAADNLAAALIGAVPDDRPDDPVALCVRPDGTLPVGLLAALTAGVAPLVVDRSWPEPAVTGMARLAGVGPVVAATEDLCRWGRVGTGPVLPVRLRGPRPGPIRYRGPTRDGYLTCPVGATEPTAVRRIDQESVARAVGAAVVGTGLGPCDSVLYRGGATSGTAPLRMLPALATGARVVLASRAERHHLVYALEAIWREGATVAELTAAEIRVLLGAGDRLAYLLLAARETLRVVWLVAGTLDSADEEAFQRLLGVRLVPADAGLVRRADEPAVPGLEHWPGTGGAVLVDGVPGDLASVERIIVGHPAVSDAELAGPGPAGLSARIRLADPNPTDPFDTMVLTEWLESMLPPEFVPRTITVDGVSAVVAGPAPETIEAWLPLVRGIVSEVLDGAPVDPTDNFFAVGGNSLRTALLVDQINDDLGVEMSIGAVMESPTIADLAALVAGAAGGPPPDTTTG